jgi:hypothetical protein
MTTLHQRIGLIHADNRFIRNRLAMAAWVGHHPSHTSVPGEFTTYHHGQNATINQSILEGEAHVKRLSDYFTDQCRAKELTQRKSEGAELNSEEENFLECHCGKPAKSGTRKGPVVRARTYVKPVGGDGDEGGEETVRGNTDTVSAKPSG